MATPVPSTLVADGGTVMVEWHGGWTIGDKCIATTVMAVFEVADGRIKEMQVPTFNRCSIRWRPQASPCRSSSNASAHLRCCTRTSDD